MIKIFSFFLNILIATWQKSSVHTHEDIIIIIIVVIRWQPIHIYTGELCIYIYRREGWVSFLASRSWWCGPRWCGLRREGRWRRNTKSVTQIRITYSDQKRQKVTFPYCLPAWLHTRPPPPPPPVLLVIQDYQDFLFLQISRLFSRLLREVRRLVSQEECKCFSGKRWNVWMSKERVVWSRVGFVSWLCSPCWFWHEASNINLLLAFSQLLSLYLLLRWIWRMGCLLTLSLFRLFLLIIIMIIIYHKNKSYCPTAHIYLTRLHSSAAVSIINTPFDESLSATAPPPNNAHTDK